MIRAIGLTVAAAAVCGALVSKPDSAPAVTTMRTPNGGIQPQATVGSDGTIHLLSYRGKAGAGDLYYSRAAAESSDFSTPIRVNSEPGSAVAAGTIRGGQIALGRRGNVHVVWNGSGQGSRLFYTRLKESGTEFEPQRNLMGGSTLLDGGCTVAADSSGRVYVLWHAGDGKSTGEEARRVWVARSQDDGVTFSAETPALDTLKGACPCCSVKALATDQGRLFTMYRGAAAKVNRDTILLVSLDAGASFRGGLLHPWKVPT